LALLCNVRVGHSRSLVFTRSSHSAEAEAKAKEGGSKEDYRGDSKFATHLKTSKAVSSFARNRTLKEQREYLPAFACREDLMKTVRDNQG
jgi:pre-mRNA-splicing factor ATP-dependent RNA helicase DHX38/PRP16